MEEASRTCRDLSLQFKVAQRINEESIARKTKELESVLREKKCVNCALCTEDIKCKLPMDQLKVISDLNERLVQRVGRIT